MKVEKIINDMVKAYFKDKGLFYANYHYGTDDKNVYIIFRGIVAYIIPKDMFILDIKKVFSTTKEFTGVAQLFRLKDEAKPITYLHDKEVGTKLICAFYEIGEGEVVAIDKKLLKSFEDGKHEITLKAVNKKSPVFVYDYDLLVGLIMPVNV